MKLEDSTPEQRTPSAAVYKNVSLSKWVNEQFPAWEQLLSAHDVARLTRRPRWALLSMMMLGRFPRKHQFHGRSLGWLRGDVLEWMRKDHAPPGVISAAPVGRSGAARPGTLSLVQTKRPSSSKKGVCPCIRADEYVARLTYRFGIRLVRKYPE